PLKKADMDALFNDKVPMQKLLLSSSNVENLIVELVHLHHAGRLIQDNIQLLTAYPSCADFISEIINEQCDNSDNDFDDAPAVSLNVFAKKALLERFKLFDTALARLESHDIQSKDYRDLLYRQVKDKTEIISAMIELNRAPGLLNQNNFKILIQY